jgi:hypothetical protein
VSHSHERRLPVLRQEGRESNRKTVEGTFALGRLFATPGVIRAVVVAGDDLFAHLALHARGDWGDVDAEDWRANDQALVGGARVLSAYCLRDGTKVWIITEADRSATTVLLPDEY